ncbi:MAG: NAD-dependent epimerase/dehydratase family protein [Bdellovibrionales bacterium]|nr:NAD-dependent epimerase/dehydratase family protein [Bdellovibrionales bacterium]
MKILITGATGFIGTWVTKSLLDRGHDIRVISRSGTANFHFPSEKIEVVRADITNQDSLTKAFQDVDSVFHLAGLIGYSRAMRQQMVTTNVVGTQNVVESCLKARCRRLVYMSSVVAIGASFDGASPLNENSKYELHDLNLGYFETKHRAEKIVSEAVTAGKIDAVILNPSTIYGPGDAKKGSRSTQVKVAQGKFPVYTSGGVNVVHIHDVVNAAYRAWEIGRSGERYILAGENILIHDLFKHIAEAAGVPPPRIYLPNPVVHTLGKVGDFLETKGIKTPLNSETAWTSTLFHWFDNSKAKRELSLNPTSAKKAIGESVLWMKEHGVI